MIAEPGQLCSVAELIKAGIEGGIAQVKSAGSPLHPLLLDDRGKMMILYDETGEDPIELACAAIKSHAPATTCCVLVIDTRLTLQDGKKWDAIVAMGCHRGSDVGEMLAQRYVPKGMFRKFRTEGEAERIGKSKDFITLALSDA